MFTLVPLSDSDTYFFCFSNTHSLEKDPNRRATPWRMLDHPWVKEMSAKRVNMGRFLSKVWGWDEGPSQVADGGTLAGGTLASAINSLNLN